MKNTFKKINNVLASPVHPIEGIRHILDVINPLSSKNDTSTQEITKDNVHSQTHNGITWIDVKNPTRKDLTELLSSYSFHPLHIDACLMRGQLDRVEVEDKYLFILVHGPSYQNLQTRIFAKKVCVFVGKNYVITVHETSQVIASVFEECQKNDIQQESIFKKSSDFLAYSILSALFKDTAQYRKEVLAQLDEIDDLVFDVKISGAFKISQLRQKIVKLKRITSSFRRILQELAVDQSPHTEGMTRYYKNLTNEANNLWETLEEASQTIEIYKDADITVSTEKTNKILTLLTIVFTLTIPTTVLGTFYGMNILLPGGLEAGSLTFLGQFTTFYIIAAVSIMSILAMLWYFKYKGWF